MISNNGKKVQTAYELERKYNLQGIKKKVLESSEELTETKNSLTNIMTALLINLADVLDSQSEISLWFYSGIPTTSNEPYTSWTTPEDHIGDLYYNTATGYVYKYTSNGWTEQDDKDLRRAMALSNVLLGTTDHERKVNFTTPTIPYYCGDWWIKEDGTLYICQTERTTGEYDSTDWINSAEYQSAVSMAMTDELGNSVLEVLSGTRIETTDKWVKFKNLANSGETIINGDNITTGSIESNNYIANTSGTKISLYDGTIDTKNFKVNSIGKVTATGVNISGEINATSGQIAGYTIDTEKGLYNGSGTGQAGIGIFNKTWAFWAGSEDSGSAPFHVGHDGSLYASVGRIATWTLDPYGISNANGSYIRNYSTTVYGTTVNIAVSNIYTMSDFIILKAIIDGNLPMISQGTPIYEHFDLNGDGVLDVGDLILMEHIITHW